MFSEKKISINAFDIVTTNTATAFTVEVNKLTLFSSVDLRIMLFDESGNLIRCDYLTLKDDDYKKWTNDDEYIFTYIANYYGYTLKLKTSTIPEQHTTSEVVNNAKTEGLLV
jgi:hypothetical protein